MSNKTLDNMELIIVEMRKTLEFGDFKGIKALSHSYETLLSQLNISNEDFNNISSRNLILNQLESIGYLHNELETVSIPKLLKEGNYIEVNHLTTTVARLSNIKTLLLELRVKLCEQYNPKIGVFSKTKEGSDYLWNVLIKDQCEEVLSQKGYYNQSEIVTNVNCYTHLFNISENTRGRRFDYIYIDSKLDVKLKQLCLSFTKDSVNVNFF